MRLVSLTRVRIDGDVIEEFVRHTLQYVDEMVIVDNHSFDGTGDILQALQAEGLPLTVFKDDFVEARAELITTYARRAFDSTRADYLLLLDADEFVRADSRIQLEAILSALPPQTHGTVPLESYVPFQSDHNEARTLARIRHRLACEKAQFKVFLSRDFADTPDSVLSPGNHYIQLSDGSPLPPTLLPGVRLAHFPVRSILQVQLKALLGWPSVLAAGYDEVNGLARQWRRLYERLQRTQDWDESELDVYAANYFADEPKRCPELVCDPLTPVARRFSPPLPSVLQVSLRFTDQLARALGSIANNSLTNELRRETSSVLAWQQSLVMQRLQRDTQALRAQIDQRIELHEHDAHALRAEIARLTSLESELRQRIVERQAATEELAAERDALLQAHSQEQAALQLS